MNFYDLALFNAGFIYRRILTFLLWNISGTFVTDFAILITFQFSLY